MEKVKCVEEQMEKELDNEKGNNPNSKKAKKSLLIIISALVIIAIAFFLVIQPKVIKPMQDYKYAIELLDSGKYLEAKEIFTNLGDYKDSTQQILNCDYDYAIELLANGKYAEAKEVFTNLGDFKDSIQQIDNCQVAFGDKLLNDGDFESALKVYLQYKNNSNVTEAKINQCKEGIYNISIKYFEDSNYSKAKEYFEKIADYSDSKSYIDKCDTEIQKAKEEAEKAEREAAEKKAAEEKAQRQKLVGTWYAKKIINYLDNDMTDQMGNLAYYYFTFYDDGTGVCSMGEYEPVGGKRNFTWELQEGENGAIGIWTLDGDSDIIFYYGDYILMYTTKMDSIMYDMRFFCYR